MDPKKLVERLLALAATIEGVYALDGSDPGFCGLEDHEFVVGVDDKLFKISVEDVSHELADDPA